MSEKRIEDKIKEDLMKSGFPLELEISKVLEDNDWRIFPNEYILEKETGNEYEVDIRALKGISTKTKDEQYKQN